MARIRTIKPEILTDEKTARLSDGAWRLFVSMWTLADDYGNLRANPKLIDAAVFWAREEPARIAELFTELEAADLVLLYRVKEQQYAHIRGWSKHQKVDHPGKPTCPGQELCEKVEPFADAPVSRETLASDSRNHRDTLAPDRDLDQDQEGKGRETRAPRAAEPPRPIPSAAPGPEAPLEQRLGQRAAAVAPPHVPDPPLPPDVFTSHGLACALKIAVEREQAATVPFWFEGTFGPKDLKAFVDAIPPERRDPQLRAEVQRRVNAFARLKSEGPGWTVDRFVKIYPTLGTGKPAGSKPVDTGLCDFHGAAGGNWNKPAARPRDGCTECKHVAAARADRKSEPEGIGGVLAALVGPIAAGGTG